MSENQNSNEQIEETPIPSADPIRKSNLERPLRGGWPSMNFWLEDNRKLVTYIGGGVIAVILLLLGYKYFILTPKEQEASQAIFINQDVFSTDSFDLALRGNGQVPGFQELADDYGATKSGKLSKYYTGIALMHKGKYEEAIDYLKDYNTDDDIIEPLRLGAIGDAYSQLKNYDDAASYYKKAVDASDNSFTTPRFCIKLGLVCEKLGRYQDAVDAYTTLKDKYPTTPQGAEADKLLARATAAANSK
jgi:tetratricopeptide (TPR) repeat protein